MDHYIDEKILRSPDFTINRLKEVGIKSLGHRVRIISAVKELDNFVAYERLTSETDALKKLDYVEVKVDSSITENTHYNKARLFPSSDHDVTSIIKEKLFEARGIPFNLRPGIIFITHPFALIYTYIIYRYIYIYIYYILVVVVVVLFLDIMYTH